MYIYIYNIYVYIYIYTYIIAALTALHIRGCLRMHTCLQNTLIRRHTSAYASIRPSIHMLTSAYVSVLQTRHRSGDTQTHTYADVC